MSGGNHVFNIVLGSLQVVNALRLEVEELEKELAGLLEETKAVQETLAQYEEKIGKLQEAASESKVWPMLYFYSFKKY